MSGRVESGVLAEGDSAGVPQDSFENHFRDKKSARYVGMGDILSFAIYR